MIIGLFHIKDSKIFISVSIFSESGVENTAESSNYKTSYQNTNLHMSRKSLLFRARIHPQTRLQHSNERTTRLNKSNQSLLGSNRSYRQTQKSTSRS